MSETHEVETGEVDGDRSLFRGEQEFAELLRHFTAEGYQRLKQLIQDIAEGNTAARSEFIGLIEPWMQRMHEQIAPRVFGTKVDEEACANAQVDALAYTLRHISSGSVQGWNDFSLYFRTMLEQNYERLQITTMPKSPKDLEKKVPLVKVRGTKKEDYEDRPMVRESRMLLHETLVAPEIEDATMHLYIADIQERLNDVLGSLTPREKEVIERRFGLNGQKPQSFEEVSEATGIPKITVPWIEQKAILKLREPERVEKLTDCL